jgi:hypothetical protein
MFNRNKIKEGEIHFQPIDPNRFFAQAVPQPALKSIPEWYKSIPRNFEMTKEEKEKKPMLNSVPQGTIKKCVPVLDALGAGYIYSLPFEVAFDAETLSWGQTSDIEFISGHDGRQMQGFGVTEDNLPIAFKWRNLNIIKTPPGWSCLFTHPLNRYDLPFTTLSGVVDTDTYQAPVNFPFMLKQGFNGKLDMGTPLVQIIPFKRTEWKSVLKEYDPTDPAMHNGTTLLEDNYKKHFWNRKSYN